MSSAAALPLASLCERIESVDHAQPRETLRHLRRRLADLGASEDLEATFERLREALEAQLADEAAHVLPGCRRIDPRGSCDEMLVAAVLGLEDEQAEALALLDRLAELAEGDAAAAVAALDRDVREHVRLARRELVPLVLALAADRPAAA